MMKKNILLIVLCILLGACNDDYMELYPETTISQESFFKSAKDLELYTNTYYNSLTPAFQDGVTDNCAIYSDRSSILDLLRGNITPATAVGWDNWGDLRTYNFFLENVGKAQGNPDEINHYIGMTRLFRAIWYYGMVKRYNDVPWYSKPLNETDEENLYKKRDPRTLIVDSVMADLDFAVKHMSGDMKNKTALNKWYAYAMMARLCLHEGTFRKYHDELDLQSTADFYLNKAVEATDAIMKSGLFTIDKTGGPEEAYGKFFLNYNLSASPEIILFKDYDKGAFIMHATGRDILSFVTGLSQSLMDSYLLIKDNKTVPFTSLPNYDKTQFVDMFKDRDPRLRQTFMMPGYIRPGEAAAFRPNLNLGGYPQIKFVPTDIDQSSTWGTSYNDLSLARYGEILLIYAEAKVELGKLTQDDVDKTINQIRDRVAVPALQIGSITEDPLLAKQYPNVSGSNKALILEIRRERRVELACEGLRSDDLFRWKAGHLLEQPQQGMYIEKFGLFDCTGDNIPDIGIYENEASNDVPLEERGKYTFYYLNTVAGSLGSIYLSDGKSGHVMSTSDITGVRKFIQPQYYYYPLPQAQRILNPNLEETIFWGK